MTLSGREYSYPDSRATNTAPESKCSGLRATTRKIYNDTSLQPQSER